MAKITLAGVDALTETGGVVSLTAAIAVDAANVSGVLPVGVTGGSGLDTVPAGTPAAGTMVWLDTNRVTSAAGGITNPTSWYDTSAAGSNPRLYIDVAQATLALYQAIFIEINSTAMVTGGSSFALAEFRIVRNGVAIMGARQLLVGNPLNNQTWIDCIHLMGTDESPSGNPAKYELQFRNHHGNSGYAGNIYPLGGETDITAAITVWGIV